MSHSDHIINFYSAYDEDGRLLKPYGQVEFITTIRYIEKYVTPNARICEIGAGTGRYSRAIADMGYAVDAVELVPHNIEVFKDHIKPTQNINVMEGNALDLHMLGDNTYDITLVLGPMYHMYNTQDKRQVIAEALRVTKPNGVVMVAYIISDAALLDNFMLGSRWSWEEKIGRGMIDTTTFATKSEPEDILELVRKEDIDSLMSGFPVQRLHYVATDLFSRYIRDGIGEMSEETYRLYLKYHFAVCERADMVGVSHHVLDVFRKN